MNKLDGEVMRVLHVTESHAVSDGGVTTVVNDLTERLFLEGVYSVVVAATDKDEPVPEGVGFIKMGECCNQLPALWSSDLKHKIQYVIQKYNINMVHIHGVWMPLQVVAARVAKELSLPFIVTAHGMLEPWLWKGKGLLGYLKKKLYFHLITYPAFQKAAYIHAITPDEGKSLKQLFPKNHQIVIPNAIDLYQAESKQEKRLEKIIFFIGRLNPVKGVDILLQAFAESSLLNEWKLIIAGPAEVLEYKQELEAYIKKHGLDNRVKLIGAVYDEDKESWYKKAWVTVVPSYSEVIGMVNLEAAMFECPTITTRETGLFNWEDGGGLLISPNKESLGNALSIAASWRLEERHTRGKLSYQLVEKCYSWASVVKKWSNIYTNLR